MRALRAVHLVLGLATLIVFLYTGTYMSTHFPEAYQDREAIRYLFRANHVYILFVSLLNLALGAYLSEARGSVVRRVQALASLLVIAAVPLLVSAFFLEPVKAVSERPITLDGAICALAGTALHALAGWMPRGVSSRSS
jgi:hypothetical protein